MDNMILKQMPPMLVGEELKQRLRILPSYDKSIMDQGMAERLIALQSIYEIFVPTQMSMEIYSKLYLNLVKSLQKKCSLDTIRQLNQNRRYFRQESYESILGGSDTFTITGDSGIGKSSSISRAIRVLTEKQTIHLDWLNTEILPFVVVQFPADCSLKGVLLEILRVTDSMLGTEYHKKAIKDRATVDMLIGNVSQVALLHIGVLVLDEVQNLVNSKNGDTIIASLVQLINNSGISICMVGTPEATMFFQRKMVLARRAIGLQYTSMEYGDVFKEFCRVVLGYCFVKNPIEVTEELLYWLYNHSGGNASIVVGLIHDTQEKAIFDGYERVDIKSLSDTYSNRMRMIHDFVHPSLVKATPKKKEKYRLPQIECDIECEQMIQNTVLQAKKQGSLPIKALIESGIQVIEMEVRA